MPAAHEQQTSLNRLPLKIAARAMLGRMKEAAAVNRNAP
jgi:hypothetical protein